MSESMDNAAKLAEADLESVPEEHVKSVASWWKKWYMTAGHKRLGRILVGESMMEGIDELDALVKNSKKK